MSLIGLIPLVGGMAVTGWLLTASDNLNAGSMEVPPAGFYLRRGGRLFFVGYLYTFVAMVLIYGLMFGFLMLVSGPQAFSPPSFGLFFGGWLLLVFGIGLASHLAFLFIVPGALEADLRGALRGLNPVHAIGDVIRHPKDSFFAGLISYLAWIIAGLGGSLCYVGIILTLGYGALVFAGALYVYERNTKGSAA
jgi:hypothetical protein